MRTIEKAEFTHKLSKEIVYCYKTIPTQEFESLGLSQESLLPMTTH